MNAKLKTLNLRSRRMWTSSHGWGRLVRISDVRQRITKARSRVIEGVVTSHHVRPR